MSKLTFIDLFAGCGGLSEGFMQTKDFKALAHVEWETPMVNTLRNRLKTKWKHTEEDVNKNVIHFDIQKTDELINGDWHADTKFKYANTNHDFVVKNGLKGLVGNQKVNLIIGGPPCQAYSIAGRAQDKNSMKEDYRNYLFESFLKVVDAFTPDIFVFENVPGLLSASPGGIPVKERIFEAFNKIGYKIRDPKMLKKANMGILRRHSAPTLEKLSAYPEEYKFLAFSSAEYCLAEEESVHYGLNSEYAHASSPIRRYADLVNQRIIKLLLNSDEKYIVPITMYDINTRAKRVKNFERNMYFLDAIQTGRTFKGVVLDIDSKIKLYIPDWKRYVSVKYKIIDGKMWSMDEKHEIHFGEVEFTCTFDLNARNWKERVIINIKH